MPQPVNYWWVPFYFEVIHIFPIIEEVKYFALTNSLIPQIFIEWSSFTPLVLSPRYGSKRVCLCVLVSSGCYNKMPWTGWLLNTGINFSQFWRLELWHQASMGLWWKPSSRLQTVNFLLYSHLTESLWGPFVEALIPFMKALPSWPNHFPKALLPNTIISDLRFSNTSIQIIAVGRMEGESWNPLDLMPIPVYFLCLWHLGELPKPLWSS